ncbi:MAG: DICT sensory domain-containing protein [Leptolyngbya sp. IPPAS B-1204]|uniref:Metal-dependent phosphohydrolase n=1 Tax=Leptolyngbya sp. NK1-12 TaxID=2547451 RepID=A0AA96WDB6_9CYAN|nr:metal-dependent phosphohydrolase [Elainella sp. C42_A2020_010]RNJ68273.1 MAG: metal-dependent phosphohydrolase [Leptolyngbya sp. IPPAS B-1204]WNZ24172.1 metal-dependent phosphohydrolase [Leptolyngbya sp. NK1-12]
MLPGSILQQLSDAHRLPSASAADSSPSGRQPLSFGVYYKNTLVALCHALEDAILQADYQPLMITAFQRGKWYLEEAERYGEIADRARQVVIMAAAEAGFAEHPTSQKANVDLVSLAATDPVAQEWHLIILSPNYTAMVLCQELSAADYGAVGQPKADLERKFYGFWTFEPGLVLETAKLAAAHVGQYNPELQQQLTTQVQEIAAHIEREEALCGLPTTEHLGEVVSRVVDYLQTRHQGMTPVYPVATNPLDSNLISNELQAFLRVAQLMDQADLSNPMAAAEVANLAEAMGQLLDLPAWQVHRLRLAGMLHRIAFLSSSSLLSSGTSVQEHAESPDKPLACPLVPGIQVLRRMQRLRAIATILTHQTEWWNGSGQPAGLAGDEIPLESRILALLISFQQRLAALRRANSAQPLEDMLTQALEDCRTQQGERWDPKLIEALSLLVSAFQQGFNLPESFPKIASGLWLMDSHAQEALPLIYTSEQLNLKG